MNETNKSFQLKNSKNSFKFTGFSAQSLKQKLLAQKSQNFNIKERPFQEVKKKDMLKKINLKNVNKINLPFFNKSFDKKKLKLLFSWYYANKGEVAAFSLIETLQKLGFKYAMKAGISLGVDDLKIPLIKSSTLTQAIESLNTTKASVTSGEVTALEEFQQFVDTWHRTSESLKTSVVQNFTRSTYRAPVAPSRTLVVDPPYESKAQVRHLDQVGLLAHAPDAPEGAKVHGPVGPLGASGERPKSTPAAQLQEEATSFGAQTKKKLKVKSEQNSFIISATPKKVNKYTTNQKFSHWDQFLKTNKNFKSYNLTSYQNKTNSNYLLGSYGNNLNPVYMMAFSGARGNLSQVRQLVGMRGLMADPQGQLVEFPIQSNFREGLTVTEYMISCYGARKGLVDTALRTAAAGYLTRRLVDVSHHQIVRFVTCGTKNSICLPLHLKNKTEKRDVNLPSAWKVPFDNFNKKDRSVEQNLLSAPLKKKIQTKEKLRKPLTLCVGRVLARDIPGVAFRNQEIDISLGSSPILGKIYENIGIHVRSPLTCRAEAGICQLCYGWSVSANRLVGLGEAVGIIAAQSIGEPGTQLTMRTFHTGGVFSGDIMEECRAKHEGVVHFQGAYLGLMVRTAGGAIAFCMKTTGAFYIKGPDKFTTYTLSPNSLLFVRQGEKVSSGSLLAQIPNLPEIEENAGEATKTILSNISGEIRQIPTVNSELESIRILAGQKEIPIYFFYFNFAFRQTNNLERKFYNYLHNWDRWPKSELSIESAKSAGEDHVRQALQRSSFFRAPTKKKIITSIKTRTGLRGSVIYNPISSFSRNQKVNPVSASAGQLLSPFATLAHLGQVDLQSNPKHSKAQKQILDKTISGPIYGPVTQACDGPSGLARAPSVQVHVQVQAPLKQQFFNFPNLTDSISFLDNSKNKQKVPIIPTKSIVQIVPGTHRLGNLSSFKEIKTLFFDNYGFFSEPKIKEQMVEQRPFKGLTSLPGPLFFGNNLKGQELKYQEYVQKQTTYEKKSILWLKKKTLIELRFFGILKLHRNFFSMATLLDSKHKKKNFQHFTKNLGHNKVGLGMTLGSSQSVSTLGSLRPLEKVLTIKRDTLVGAVGLFTNSAITCTASGLAPEVLPCVKWAEAPSARRGTKALTSTFLGKIVKIIPNPKCYGIISNVKYNKKWVSSRNSALSINLYKKYNSFFIDTKENQIKNYTDHKFINNFPKNISTFLQSKENLFNCELWWPLTVVFFSLDLNKKKVKCKFYLKGSLINKLVANFLKYVKLNKYAYLFWKLSGIIFIKSYSLNSYILIYKKIFAAKNNVKQLKEQPIFERVQVLPRTPFPKGQGGVDQTFKGHRLNCKTSNLSVQKNNFEKSKTLQNFINERWWGKQQRLIFSKYLQDNKLIKNNKYKFAYNFSTVDLEKKNKYFSTLVRNLFLRFTLKTKKNQPTIIPLGYNTSNQKSGEIFPLQGNTSFNYFETTSDFSKTSVDLTKKAILTHADRVSYKLRVKNAFNQRSNYFGPQIGSFVNTGQEFIKDHGSAFCGQVIEKSASELTLRFTQNILYSNLRFRPARVSQEVKDGNWLRKGTSLVTLPYISSVTGDIVAGIPKIEQLFEARGEALEETIEKIWHSYKLAFVPKSKAVRECFKEIGLFVVAAIQKVYSSQGVYIADKHLEVIIRQMTRRALIIDPGDTEFLPEEFVDLHTIECVNWTTYGNGASYRPRLIGITKASLTSNSFLSSASFQQTARVLERETVLEKTDRLLGLKERVMMGALIDAGTGSFQTDVFLPKVNNLGATSLSKNFFKKFDFFSRRKIEQSKKTNFISSGL